jgi:hypothetical protein
MPDPLQELIAAGLLPKTDLPPTSRYSSVEVDAWQPPSGGPPVPYLRRRFCPPVERGTLRFEVRIVEGDRRDLLAAGHLGDADLWWRLADANGLMDPRRLTAVPGRLIRITFAEDEGGRDA